MTVEGMPGFAAFGRLGPGARLGEHGIVACAGRGGMAVVWEARGSDGSRVALKTMLPSVSVQAQLEKMFVAEARLTTKLRHPNVCAVRGHGEERGIRFLVMEWIDGGSLARMRDATRPMPAPIAAAIALDVARGLASAHEAADEDGAPLGIVHRDVSPHNILVGRDGVAKIADFGVAKVSAGADGTKSGFVKGKVRYMSPEQAYGEAVDARTDVFALGIVLVEAITGQHPFAAETDVATLAKIAAPEPLALPADLDPDFRAVIVRATATDVADRFATMRELADALADVPRASTSEVAAWVSDRLVSVADAAPERSEPRTLSSGSTTTRARRTSVALGVGAFVLAFGAYAALRPNASPAPLPVARSAPAAASAAVSVESITAAPSNVPPREVAPTTAPVASGPMKTAVLAAPARPLAAATAPGRSSAAPSVVPPPASAVVPPPPSAAPAPPSVAPPAPSSTSALKANVLRNRD